MGKTELHVREIARRGQLNEASVRQELAKLRSMDLVAARRDGNRVYYRANQEHPIYQDVHNLVMKTTGLVEVLRKPLKGADISIAFVFGSVAAGKEAAHSDIDMMVIGSIGLRSLTGLLSGVSHRLGREINPHVMSESEYRQRRKAGDHFVTNVLRGPKLFILGTEHDFEAMGS